MSPSSTGARCAAAAAIGLGFGQIVGCTRMLGIDGEYGLAIDGDGGRPSSGGRGGVTGGTGGSGAGAWETGGTPASAGGAGGVFGVGETGGTSGTGGAIDRSAGGGAGVPPVDAGSPLEPCTPGSYEGVQSGTHAPTVSVVGIPFPIKGAVKFQLNGPDGGTTAILDGTVEGNLTVTSSLAPPFTATIQGRIDCVTGHFDGTLDGEYWLSSNTSQTPAGTFHGTHTGEFANGSFSGKWEEHEPNAPTTPPNNQTGRGSGTWSASWVGP